jgi:FlaA1/EpsC-like NDP-sugar epimerase
LSSTLFLRIFSALIFYTIFLFLLNFFKIINHNNQFILFIFFYILSFAIISRILFVEVNKFLLRIGLNKKNCLIFGAGWAGVHLSTQMNDYNILGFIDDDKGKINLKINNTKVYSRDKINELITNYKITIIFLAISNISNQDKNEIINYLSQFKVECKIIPTLNELVTKNIGIKDFKSINVKDLIQRNYKFNKDKIFNELKNKIVLITGAGGSIGSEIVKQILDFHPKKIIAVDNSEYNLYELSQSFKNFDKNKNDNLDLKLIDIKDYEKNKHLFEIYKPQYIFHAAAYKHVPLLEDNFSEALTNNFLATINLVKLSLEFKISKFVYISSDKAVRPTNIMGATKRLSELHILSYLENYDKKNLETKFSIVRFGNVIASKGSVLPLFNKQIASGGPVTITHPDIERFFMTIPEAVGLVLETCTLVKKIEIYVLDMGKPIKIIDLAKKIINLSGLKIKDSINTDGDIEIKIIGLRPGEKLFEELFINKNIEKTSHKQITRDNEEGVDLNILNNLIDKLSSLNTNFEKKSLLKNIEKIVDGKFK